MITYNEKQFANYQIRVIGHQSKYQQSKSDGSNRFIVQKGSSTVCKNPIVLELIFLLLMINAELESNLRNHEQIFF